MKNCTFFGTSILEGFCKGFGRVLGTQNLRFSHFFRYFFDANFRVQVGRAKNRKKMRKCKVSGQFGGMCGPGGKVYYRMGGRQIWPQFQAWPQDRPLRLGFLTKEGF